MREFFRRYRIEAILFFAFWASFAFFYHLRAGWNVNSRLALTLAVVDRGTCAIDFYHRQPLTETNDKAYYRGHYYCDKSPALSFMAVPFYFIGKPLLNLYPPDKRLTYVRQWCTLWTAGLMGALAAALFYRLMRVFGATNEEGLALTLFLIYGTNVGGYTSLFFPYLPATACLLGAYLIALHERDREGGFRAHAALAFGFLISMAGFFEYFYALAGAALLLYGFVVARKARPIVLMIAGAIPPVLALAAYCYALFDEFALPYKYEFDPGFNANMAKGFMGIQSFKPAVLYYITVHPYKGIFFFSPILLFAIIGALWAKRLPRLRSLDIALCWGIGVGYLVFTASYYLWWGGWSMGARQLIPMVPFLFVPLLGALRRHPALSNMAIFAGVVSMLLNIPAIALDPQIDAGGYADEILFNPTIAYNLHSSWLDKVLPAFYSGQMALTPLSNFLPGLWPLAVLASIWTGVLYIAVKRGNAPAA